MRFTMVLVAAIVVGSSCDRTSEYEVRPGIGVGEFVVGKTGLTSRLKAPETRKRYDENGLTYYSADGEVVSWVAVYGEEYHTGRGVRVGSTADEIRSRYGEGTRSSSFFQSRGTPLAKFADYGLMYPGIGFVIIEERVIAIVVLQEE